MPTRFRAITLIPLTLSLWVTTAGTQRLAAERNFSDGWKMVSPGLMKRTGSKGRAKFAEYRAISMIGSASLRSMMKERNFSPIADIAFSSLRPRLLRVQSSQCSINLTNGVASIDSYDTNLAVTCATGITLNGEIDVEPPPGSLPQAQYNFSGTTHLSAAVYKSCGQACRAHDGIDEPDDWRIQQFWSASDGESGYECYEGDSYPSPC